MSRIKKRTTAYDEEELLGPNLVGLLLGGGEVLLLPDVGHERDHLVALVDKPGEDARRVWPSAPSVRERRTETAGVREQHTAL